MKSLNRISRSIAALREQAIGFVALAAMVIFVLTLLASAARASTTMTASPTWNAISPGEMDVYYPDNGGVMFTVNSPGATIRVISLGRFYFGAGTYTNSNLYTGPWPGNSGIRTLALSLVTDPGTPGITSTANATVIASTTLDPATAPIAAGTQVTINYSGGAVGGWQYADLSTPVDLVDGQTYLLTATQLGANTSSGQEYARADTGTDVPLNSSYFTFDAGASGFNGGIAITSGSATFSALGDNYRAQRPDLSLADDQVGPVNLLFDVLIPEPASLSLLAVGSLLALRRNRRAQAIASV